MSGQTNKDSKNVPFFITKCLIVVAGCIIFLGSGEISVSGSGSLFHMRGLLSAMVNEPFPIVKEETPNVYISAADEGQVVFRSSEGYYRYGPSIMQYEDGSYDVWMSSPGNSSSQWDWIRYRHSEDGVTWTKDKVVLYPTPGSADQCSVCDPDVVYFDGYYYLAYTGTSDYRRGGMNNSAFVARSKNPDGPYEKWNGKGWGGSPKPFLKYEDNPNGWGI